MTVTINGTSGVTTPEVTLDNGAADGGQVVLKSTGYSNWNLDNYSGRLRGYYGSTEYFTVDSSGNVGIGTSSPGGKLDVVGDTYLAHQNSAGLLIRNLSGEACIDSYNSPITANYPLRFLGSYIRFLTSDTERMRIDPSGNLLVNQAASFVSGGGYLQVSGATSTQNAVGIKATGSGTQYLVGLYNSSNTVVGSINTNGTNTTYSTSSDYRLKENIQPMQNALATVAQLNPVTYTWKADGSDGQGFIAHELQAVVPDCVTGEKDAVDDEGKPVYQGIDTSFLVATLTKAIQEQQEQIEQMKQEIAAMKGAA